MQWRLLKTSSGCILLRVPAEQGNQQEQNDSEATDGDERRQCGTSTQVYQTLRTAQSRNK
jgi:hypothetical protein